MIIQSDTDTLPSDTDTLGGSDTVAHELNTLYLTKSTELNSSKEEEANASIEEYGKTDINSIIQTMKDACNEAGIQYMAGYKEREFAKHITSKKLAKEIEKYNMPLEMFIKNIIKLSSQQFMKACNSPSDFYKNWWYVLNASKKAQESWTKVYDLN